VQQVHSCTENYHTCEGQRGLQVQKVHSCTGKITIHVRDREDFRCSRSTAEITIHVRDREDFRCRRSTAAQEKLPYM
jgi:hypothetical protein